MIEMSHMFDISHAEDVYFASISGKTAALLVAACSLGAIEGGLGLTSTKALEEFGYHLGVLFQITDDILDLEGSVETLGKPACNDLINGVYTLPTIQALREDSALRSMLGRPLSPDDAAEARDMVAEAGGLRYARERSEWHAVAAKRALERIRTPDTSSVQALTQLVDHVRSKMLGSSANRQPAQRNGSPSAPRRDRR
jgi:geranylgeranyl pyrophosphate synthase